MTNTPAVRDGAGLSNAYSSAHRNLATRSRLCFPSPSHAIERERRKVLELGDRVFYAATLQHVGWIALLAGRPERADAELREDAEILEAAGERGWLSTLAAVLAGDRP